jgi:glycosyltransferase involved in cell wall biosynthesis
MPSEPLLSENSRPDVASRDNLHVVIVDPSCFSLPYDYSLCEGLVQQGAEVKLARSEFLHSSWRWPARSFGDWQHFYPMCHGKARMHRRGRLWKYAKGIEHAIGMEAFLTQMRRTKPDIIHFQWLPLPLVDAFFLKRLAKIAPLVLTSHNTNGFFHGNVSRWQTLTARSAFAEFSAVIVHAAFSQARILERGLVAPEKLHLIPHGVLSYYRSLAPARFTADREKQVILFFGSIEPYKGLDILIEAFALLPADLRNATRLLVAGKPGIDMAPIRKRAQTLGVDQNIQWELRYLEEEEIPQLFDDATLVALPYTDIDQSGVLMTALAFGKPVVASRIGGIAETLVDGVHGRLTPPGDIPALAAALESVLIDKDKQKAMQAAIGHLSRGALSWDSISQKTLEVYSHIANQFKQSSHAPSTKAGRFMKDFSNAQLNAASHGPTPLNSQSTIQEATKLCVVASRESRIAPPADRPSIDGNSSESFLRALGRQFALRFRRLCFDEQWSVAVRPRVNGPAAFDLKAFSVLNPPHDRFYADPFLVERGGRSYLFFEELVFAERKGTISFIEFNERGFIGSPTMVLEAKHHLSYPFLFDWKGETYMLPESRDSGRIELFRAVDFPHHWEFAGCLLENVWAVDTTIFEHQGRFWMFAGGIKENGKINSELFLYYADSPLGPWLPHPGNPVVVDASRARPAGQVFTHEGELIRPGQDCSQSYGGAIALNRIDVLSPTEYEETPIRTLGPEWFPSGKGTHTLNHSEHYQTADARILIFQPKLIARKLWWSFCGHLLKQKA